MIMYELLLLPCNWQVSCFQCSLTLKVIHSNHEVYTKALFVWKIAVGGLLCITRFPLFYIILKKLWNMKTSHICPFPSGWVKKVPLLYQADVKWGAHTGTYFPVRVILKYLLLFQVYIKHAIHMKDLRGSNTGLAEVGLVDWMSASHGTGAPNLAANYLPHVCTSEF